MSAIDYLTYLMPNASTDGNQIWFIETRESNNFDGEIWPFKSKEDQRFYNE